MELRIGCKFKFVYCREPQKKKIGPNGPFGDPGGPFLSTGSSKKKKKKLKNYIFQFLKNRYERLTPHYYSKVPLLFKKKLFLSRF